MPPDDPPIEKEVAPAIKEEEETDRAAQPVDAEQPPRLPFPVVGMGASAGGLESFIDFFKAMPAASGLAFVLIQHLPPDRESIIAELLSKHTKMRVQQIKDGISVEADHVYVIRPGHTVTIKDGRLHLGKRVEKPGHGRPVDDFFRSLAEEQRERAICIIMSGMGSNGAAGAQAIKAVGGLCIAQDPESTQFPSMPRHLIDSGYTDYILRPAEMPEVLINYARHPYTNERTDAESLLRREHQRVTEILAVLRTRTRQDFSGYKKPTLIRRVQRRMGLNRITSMGEYAKFLRQNAAEVSALADDMLIHVTGFFRDPEAWEALRSKVIVPLVAGREEGDSIRCWVAACSSGEEAYSLALLLLEESEQVNKPLDIKVFATDTAERTLANARAGLYPGGIEAEMPTERLNRFFEKEDSLYRVRQDLREKVIFAPQNVLQDPPFSRLDIATCRNLLIYLEPQVQHRVLYLLHFGLREGGALFLGTSETILGEGGMFEPIDKKARIFKRTGPTRHTGIDFPVPPPLIALGELGRPETRQPPRLSVAQLTTRALLAQHIRAALTVDREHRVVYFHGDTRRYLHHPPGEPTRELMAILGEDVRGAVRTALHRAMTQHDTVTAVDGWIQTEGGRRRVIVTVSPLEKEATSGYYVISFDDRGEAVPESERGKEPSGEDRGDLQRELQRVRDELQSTIEELQSTYEEHKASAEEVMSMNEELQSTNEELETSKEEMQSLNEELTTVNAQLQAKMQEQERTSDDLASLLSSTDIAVIFLDPQLHIRRFTPAATKLLDLIGTDVGRPLADLALKFSDPELMSDIRAVLQRLVPIGRDISAEDGRWYARRVLPYRTANNRIHGVVITFVDITDLKETGKALQVSETRLADELRTMTRMHAMTLRVLDAPDLPSALNEILGAAVELTRADMGIVQLYDPQTHALKVVADQGFDPESLRSLERVSADEGTAFGRALRDGRRVAIEDLDLDPELKHFRAAAAFAPFRAVQITPLKSARGKVLGMLATHFRQPRRILQHDEIVIDLIAQEAADLIHRMQLDTELNRLLQTERASRQALDELTRLQSEFLATVSHELRTPLTGILGWAKMLDRGGDDPEMRKESVGLILRCAEAQARLIDDLLESSSIAAGKFRLDLAETDLAELAEAAIETIRPTAEAKGLRLESRIEGEIGRFMADPGRLRQVLWNLLANAVKYTPEGGEVSLAMRGVDGEVEIRVQDTGAGIDLELLPHIFNRFCQSDLKTGGLGLGLTISKQLVELHGGTIKAESPGRDRGSVFIIRLPMRPLARRTRQAADRGTKRSGADLKGTKVLFVEDDPPTNRAITLVLQQAGAEVTSASSGEDALRAFREGDQAVLVFDIGLPDFDGHTLLGKIRDFESKKKRKPAPAVAVTAYAREEDRRKALGAGFQIFMAKPIDPDHLVATLAELVAKPKESSVS